MDRNFCLYLSVIKLLSTVLLNSLNSDIWQVSVTFIVFLELCLLFYAAVRCFHMELFYNELVITFKSTFCETLF